MSDIVIVSPSPNMKTFARELASYGKYVKLVSVSEFPYFSPKRIFYFFKDTKECFTENAKGGVEKEDNIFLFKKNIFSTIKLWNLDKRLEEVDKRIVNGTFVDLIMFRRGMLHRDNHKEDIKEFPNIESVCRVYPDSKIISSKVLGVGNSGLCIWETDYDLTTTFASDYFVFVYNNIRVEAFSVNNKLYTISKINKPLEVIKSIIPSLSKFSFKEIGRRAISINSNPWVMHNVVRNVSLINDYSFFATSIDMPSSWYSRLANAIANGK